MRVENNYIEEVMVENIYQEPTKNTPLVDFSTSGKLIMKGSAFAENARMFFDPIIEWVRNLETKEVTFDLYLEYINTACAKKLFELLKRLEGNANLGSVKVNWKYEEGDEDSLETGQILKESMGDLNFSLVEDKVA